MTLTLTKLIAYWHSDYETGNLQVDQEHQEIFEIVNTLKEAVVTKQNFGIIDKILYRLASHAIEHFQTEETLSSWRSLQSAIAIATWSMGDMASQTLGTILPIDGICHPHNHCI